MKKYRLKNGVVLLFEKTSSKSVAIEIMVKVGSNYENKKISGISHFIEHMLFEGTEKRKDSREIANEIEKYGAEFNAYTTAERTAFFIKIVNKKFDVALDILSDIISNPLFNKKNIEKEKGVILKEINMFDDDPKQYQWILFQKNLFEKHPAKNPTYGTAEAIRKISRNDIIGYFSKYYAPNNMVISIVGNVSNVKEKTEKYLGNLKYKQITPMKKIKEPLQKKIKKIVEKRKTLNSYIVLGYKSVPRVHYDSYVLDVISAILGRGQSGWLFDEIRNKLGLAYYVGVQNEHESDYGYFSVFVNLDKKNIEKTRQIILQQFRKLYDTSKTELEDAKTFIEGNYALSTEDNFRQADNLALWETIKDASLASSYIKNIKKVTLNDVKRAARKYLNDKYTLIVIEQK